MTQIVRTASALRDLDETWNYIAVENCHPEAADRLIDEIDEVLKLLAAQPQLGEAVDHLRHNTRRFVVRKAYLLFYDADDDGIRLLRVLHGARLIGPEDLQE